MKIKALLVNPWIYDFAAANLWALPLGLLMVAEELSGFDIDLAFIDCTDAGTGKKYAGGKYTKEITEKPECLRGVPRRYGRYGISADRFRSLLAAAGRFDIVFMTSIMSYWYPGVQTAIGIIKEIYKDVPVVLGGIYPTLWKDHASSTSGADFIFKGRADGQLRIVFNTFGHRIRERGRRIPHRDLGFYADIPFAPVLTGTGCPFRCTYCASKLLSNGFEQRDPFEAAREIYTLQKRGVRDFVFYDDALLVNADEHIKVLLGEIVELGVAGRFHCPNGLHARFVDDELAALMKRSGFRTIRLSLETSDDARQTATGGKVSSEDLDRAVTILKQNGFSKEDIGVYLMYGLPGQDLEEVEEGVRFLKSLDVRIHLAEFSPIPGTESWNQLIEMGTITGGIDPLLTNNTVFSLLFAGYDPGKVTALKREVKDFNAR